MTYKFSRLPEIGFLERIVLDIDGAFMIASHTNFLLGFSVAISASAFSKKFITSDAETFYAG